jgi:hypothetical protein
LSHLDLWAQRVDGGGTLEGSAFVVSNTTDWEEFPGVIGSNSNQQYLVTWTVLTTSSAHIFGRSIATNGSFLSDVTLVGGIYAYAADGVNGPAGDMLIAYEEIASGGYDLFGVLLGNRVYLPLLTK